jgi:hypothetical protein
VRGSRGPTPSGGSIRAQIRIGLGDDAWELLRNALIFTLVVVALDLVFTHAPRRLFIDPLEPTVREGYVRGLLTLFGLPSALLVTLTSLAIPNLSPYANPSLILRYRSHPETAGARWWARIAGRGNPFRWALQVALYVAASLFALLVIGGLRWSGQSTPVLALITLAAACEVALLLAFVYWVITLRHPSAVIKATLALGENALRELKSLPPKHAFTPMPPATSRGPYKVRYREQDVLKAITEALAQATLRALQDRQPFAAREGLEALEELFEQCAAIRPPGDEWYSMVEVSETPNPRVDWLRLLVLDGIHDVLVACAGAHYLSVGMNALKVLERIGADLLTEGDPDDPSTQQQFERLIRTYGDAFDESLQFQEHNLRVELLSPLKKHLDQLAGEAAAPSERSKAWIQLFAQQLPDLLQDLWTPAVTVEDFGALRSVTGFMSRIAGAIADARPAIAASAVNLGATALALRSDGACSLIAAWIAGVFDPTGSDTASAGERLVGMGRLATTDRNVMRPELSTETTGLRADFVSVDYVEVFLVLVAARGVQFDREWDVKATARIRTAVKDLPQSAQRCKWVCDRVGNATRLGETERKEWTAKVDEVLTS